MVIVLWTINLFAKENVHSFLSGLVLVDWPVPLSV